MRHEDVLLFSFGKCPYFPQETAGDPYQKKRKGRDDSGDNYGDLKVHTDIINQGTRKPISVLSYDRVENAQHPTQKPVALMEYLIRTYTSPGDTVLDNCMGSGTTGVACANTGREFIGIEQSWEYFKIAADRIELAQAIKWAEGLRA